MLQSEESVKSAISLETVLAAKTRRPASKAGSDALRSYVMTHFVCGLSETSPLLINLCNEASPLCKVLAPFVVEVEVQLHLQPPACDCCCNLKYAEFSDRLAKRFGTVVEHAKNVDEAKGLSSMQRLIVYEDNIVAVDDTCGGSDAVRIRVFFGHDQHTRDKKLRICQTLINLADAKSVANVAVSVEAERKRLSSLTEEELEEVRIVLRNASKYSFALNRYHHPADKRLSITYREPANRDESFITIEYEVTADYARPPNLLLLKDFLSLFPHHCWGPQTRSERCRLQQKFLHIWRPKVYTLCLPPEERPRSRDECINDMLNIVRESSDSAVKWNGTQHIFKFDFRVGNNFCALHGISANYVLGYYFELPVRAELLAEQVRNKEGNFMLENFSLFLSTHFFVAEVLDVSAVFRDNESICNIDIGSSSDDDFESLKCPNCCATVSKSKKCIIFVDVTNEHLCRYTLADRRRLLHALLSECTLNFLSKNTNTHFCLQKWFTCPSTVASKAVASRTMADGILVYSGNVDVLWKIKQHHSVDLVNTGVLHTEDGAFVARATYSAAHCRISEYALEWKDDTLKLCFLRTRNDRVLGNSVVEFCEAAKAAWSNPFDWI